MTRSSMLALVVLLAASAGAQSVCDTIDDTFLDITRVKKCSEAKMDDDKAACNKAYLVQGVGPKRSITMCKWNKKKGCENGKKTKCAEKEVCDKVTDQANTWQNPDMTQSSAKTCKKADLAECTNHYIAAKPKKGKAKMQECALDAKSFNKCVNKKGGSSKGTCKVPTLCEKISWNVWKENMHKEKACKKQEDEEKCPNTYFADKKNKNLKTGCKWNKKKACQTDKKDTCDDEPTDAPVSAPVAAPVGGTAPSFGGTSGDGCSITPGSGKAVTTSFVISTTDSWETANGPLDFTFIVYDSVMTTRPDDVLSSSSSSDTCASDICERVFRFQKSTETSKTLILPQGDWTIVCKATDSDGNAAEAAAAVTVNPMSN